MRKLFRELKRRRVFQSVGVYAVVAFVVLQIADLVVGPLGLPDWTMRLLIILELIGFPIALVIAWAFQINVESDSRMEGKPSGTPPPRTLLSRGRLGIVITVFLLAAGAVGWWLRPNSATATVRRGAEVIAVLPFHTSGAGVERLGEGMVDLISMNLDAIGAIRTISPATVLHEWRSRADTTGIDLNGSLALGRSVNAGSVLLGGVVAAGGQTSISATLYSTNGRLIARAQVAGSGGNLLGLVDSLSIRLLRDIWRSRTPIPRMRLSAITTGAIGAIRAYMDGARYYRRTQWDSAVIAFERAVDIDSTFALGHMRLAQVRAWQGGPAAARPYIAAATRHAGRLPKRERALLLAFRLFANADPAALDTMLAYVGNYPEDPDAWFLLGEIQYHRRYRLALEPERIYRSFERVLDLDPTVLPAMIHLVELSVETADTARLNSYLRNIGGRIPPTLAAPFQTARDFLMASPDSAVRVLMDYVLETPENPEYDYQTLLRFMIASTFHSERHTPDIALAAFDSVFSKIDAAGPRYAELYPLYRMTALGAGVAAEFAPPSTASVELDSLEVALLRYAPAIFGYPAALAAPGVSERLSPVDGRGSEHPAAVVIDAYKALARGNIPEARRLVERVRRDTTDGTPELDALATALSGWALLAKGDTTPGIRRIEEGMREVNKAENVFARVRFERISALAARPKTREEGLRRLRYGFGDAYPIIPLTYLRTGMVFESMGDWQAAKRAYEQVLNIWSNAGPALSRRIESVRRALDRVRDRSAENVGR